MTIFVVRTESAVIFLRHIGDQFFLTFNVEYVVRECMYIDILTDTFLHQFCVCKSVLFF